MKTNTLKPGLLVSIKTSVRGNVRYAKRDIEAEHSVDGGALVAKWETERTVMDAAEHAAALKVRSESSYLVARVCAATAFGYLCPDERAGELDEAMKAAREKIDAFNATASITRVAIYMIAGRVADDNVEAMRAISAEVSELIGTMQSGVEALDAEKIRDAAKRAREVSTMLSESGRMQVASAIESARKAATAITKAVKAGEVAAAAVDAGTLEKLAGARLAFLDMEAAGDVVAIPEAPRALDFEPEAPACPTSGNVVPARDLEV